MEVTMDISRSRYLRGELMAERISMGELMEIEAAFAEVPDEHLRDVRANAMAEDMLDEIDDARGRNDPIHGIDHGPCSDFAPDTLGDDPNVCTTCFYHRIDHAMDAGGIGHPLT